MNEIERCEEFLDNLIDKKMRYMYVHQKDLYRLVPGGCVYIIQLGETDIYKIGFSIDPQKRIKQLQRKSPIPLNLLWWNFGHDYKSIEKYLHHRFREQRVQGEWFQLSTEDILWITETYPLQYYGFPEQNKN